MPRPSLGKEERVGKHERNAILQGAQAHGAGDAEPKDRAGRQTPSLLAANSVVDDGQGSNYGGKRTSPGKRRVSGGGGGPAKLKKLASLTMDSFSALLSNPPSPTETVTTVCDEQSQSQSQRTASDFDAAKLQVVQSWRESDTSALYPALSPTSSFATPPGAYTVSKRRIALARRITTVQRFIVSFVTGLVALFAVVHAAEKAPAAYAWLSKHAVAAARRMEVLHDVLDPVSVWANVGGHLLIDLAQWGVANLPAFVVGGTGLVVALGLFKLRLIA